MTWNGTLELTTGHIVTEAEWNQQAGSAGNINHLHSGSNLVVERLTYVSGLIWQTSSNYLAGKLLLLLWNNVPIPTMPVSGGTAFINESAANQITFTALFKTNFTGGADTAAGDVVFAVYLKSE